jgi:hypothetical protein
MWRDDDELLAALADAVRAASAVPREFVEAGQAAYAWRAIDAELATLTYDSAAAQATPDRGLAQAGTRAEPAALRALTFAAGDLEIEVQIGADGLLGQVVPPQAGQVRAEPASGPAAVAAVDEVGWFEIRPVPAMPFRLRVTAGDRADVLTGWITP